MDISNAVLRDKRIELEKAVEALLDKNVSGTQIIKDVEALIDDDELMKQ